MKELRLALYDVLTEESSIKNWWQPFLATDRTEKPYGVITFGPVTRVPSGPRFRSRLMHVWVYVEKEDFTVLDDYVEEITGLLTDRIVQVDSGNHYLLEWEHEGQDFIDPELNALTRRLDFRVPLVRSRK
jgi:hypothetical protein